MSDYPSGNQAEHLDRVAERIGDAILAFYAEPGRATFRAEDLRDHIRRTVGGVAPGSPDRVMRDLRRRRLINYRVVNRRQSLYEILPSASQEGAKA